MHSLVNFATKIVGQGSAARRKPGGLGAKTPTGLRGRPPKTASCHSLKGALPLQNLVLLWEAPVTDRVGC